jgi:hypothetical protein
MATPAVLIEGKRPILAQSLRQARMQLARILP